MLPARLATSLGRQLKRSHIGAAGMRSELTFERGGTVDIARVKSGEANVFAEGRSHLHSPHL